MTMIHYEFRNRNILNRIWIKNTNFVGDIIPDQFI